MALAFNQDRCCHLAISLQLTLLHCGIKCLLQAARFCVFEAASCTAVSKERKPFKAHLHVRFQRQILH